MPRHAHLSSILLVLVTATPAAASYNTGSYPDLGWALVLVLVPYTAGLVGTIVVAEVVLHRHLKGVGPDAASPGVRWGLRIGAALAATSLWNFFLAPLLWWLASLIFEPLAKLVASWS